MSRYYYIDEFHSKCRALEIAENDIFLTFQPTAGSTLSGNELDKIIHELLEKHDLTALNVIEQTFKIKRINKTGQYINHFHSHMLIKNSNGNELADFKKDLTGIFGSNDLVEKYIWDLEGLIEYLTKQASHVFGIVYSTFQPNKPVHANPDEKEEIVFNTSIQEQELNKNEAPADDFPRKIIKKSIFLSAGTCKKMMRVCQYAVSLFKRIKQRIRWLQNVLL